MFSASARWIENGTYSSIPIYGSTDYDGTYGYISFRAMGSNAWTSGQNAGFRSPDGVQGYMCVNYTLTW
jgi:hypothetical protein